MTTVQVLFPVLRGTRRFHIQKGRRWSVIEHLLLDVVSREPGTASEFAAKSGLPRRVIVEAFIRLMRAGWVEISVVQESLIFRATPLGMEQAPLDDLPTATVTEAKKRGFIIEQITGGVFRSRELDVRANHLLPIPSEVELVVTLPEATQPADAHPSEVFTAIEGEDELIVGVDPGDDRLGKAHAVVTVRDGVIEGLPARASLALRGRIVAEAAKAVEAARAQKAGKKPKPSSVPAEAAAATAPELSPSRPALFDNDDLIVDGAAHRSVLERTIRSAQERIILHSTFVTDGAADAVLPLLQQAAARGVLIDLLWGQDEIGTSTNTSQEAAHRLKGKIAEAGRSNSIRVHRFSTHSHAKVIVADNGRGRWQAVLGSCNWLASNFESFEASVRLRDPALVGELICRLAQLACGRPGIWNDLAVEMTVLGRQVESCVRGNGRAVPMRLLFAPDHARLTLEARDRARKRVFVLSHRWGISGRPVALLPLLAAVKANDIGAIVYYGRTTGPLSGIGGADLTREFAAHGVNIIPVHRPRLHAKVLGWDDDALAVTSLNWLSADPPDLALNREIGILIEAPRIADNFFRVFENAHID